LYPVDINVKLPLLRLVGGEEGLGEKLGDLFFGDNAPDGLPALFIRNKWKETAGRFVCQY